MKLAIRTASIRSVLARVTRERAKALICARNPLIADQVAVNYRKTDITARQKAMIEFAIKVSAGSCKVGDDDLETLQAHGFTEENVWDITAIPAFFGLSNRLANDEFYAMGR